MSDEIRERQEFGDRGGDDPLLVQPSLFLTILAESLQDDIAFFTHDMSGIVTYLSPSAGRVLNQDHRKFIRKSISEVLTDNPCNDPFRGFAADGGGSLGPTFVPSRRVEIKDSEGNQHQLEYWRTTILREGRPVGVSGILRRVDAPAATPVSRPSTSKGDELLKRAMTLSSVERDVVEMVIQGHMNKKIASAMHVAERTIESRRARAMAKLQAKSLPELVQIWIQVRDKLL